MKTGIDLNKKQTIVRKYLLGLLMFCGFSWQVRGAVVDTLWIHSEGMDKEIQTVVISPGEGKATTPVIYLLHGHGGNAKSWVDDVKPDLPELADLYGICLVCPDAQNSWYWDSPRDSSSRYETFVSEELIRYVEARYPVVKERRGRLSPVTAWVDTELCGSLCAIHRFLVRLAVSVVVWIFGLFRITGI